MSSLQKRDDENWMKHSLGLVFYVTFNLILNSFSICRSFLAIWIIKLSLMDVPTEFDSQEFDHCNDAHGGVIHLQPQIQYLNLEWLT